MGGRSQLVHTEKNQQNYESMAGVGGFEPCPHAPNCPVYKCFQYQKSVVHGLCTNNDLGRRIKLTDEVE